MSKSVAYYSHTYYDVNGYFDAIKCDIWYAHKILDGACIVHGRAAAARWFSHKVWVPSKT